MFSNWFLHFNSISNHTVSFSVDVSVIDSPVYLLDGIEAFHLRSVWLGNFLFSFIHRLWHCKQLSNELIQLFLIHLIDSNDTPLAAFDRHKLFNVSLFDFAQILQMRQKLWLLHQILGGNLRRIVISNLSKYFQEVALISRKGKYGNVNPHPKETLGVLILLASESQINWLASLGQVVHFVFCELIG